MFGFYAYEKLMNVPEVTIWNDHYFDKRWQTLFDAFNSIPLIILGMLGAYAARSHIVGACLLSMLLHTLTDLPVHHDDGHRHFFPLSDWRFDSPVSYWDPAHYGHLFKWFELFVVAIGTIWLVKTLTGAMRYCAASIGVLHVVFLIFAFFYWGGGL